MKKKDKDRLKLLIAGGVIFMIAMQGGYLSQFGIDPMAFDSGGLIPVSDKDVYVKINTKNSLTLAACDIAVNMYDVDGNFLDSVTTSSGVATFGVMVKVGQVVQLQARQAAPATTTYYITDLVTITVPNAGAAGDTLSLGTIFADQVTTSNPTMVIRNGWNNATIDDAVNDEFNTTDTGCTITVENTITGTYYGATDSFVDMISGKEYLSGVWVLWKGTANQPWVSTPTYAEFDQTNSWYLWRVDPIFHNDNIADISDEKLSLILSVGADTFTTDATIVIDVFDMLCITDWNAGMYSAALVDGHSVGVTAITTAAD